MLHASAVQTRTCTHTFVERYVLEEIHPDGGRRGAANTHFAKGNDITSRSNTIAHMLHSHVGSMLVFLLAHGCLMQEILRAVGNLMIVDRKFHQQIIVMLRVDDVGRKIVIHTHIDETQMKVVLMTEHIHATTTFTEVQQLLPSHFARRHTHPLALNAVVGSKKCMALVAKFRIERVLYQTNLLSQFLQFT